MKIRVAKEGAVRTKKYRGEVLPWKMLMYYSYRTESFLNYIFAVAATVNVSRCTALGPQSGRIISFTIF